MVVFGGCKSSQQFDYEGTWRGTQTVADARPDADPDVVRSIGNVELRFLPHGRYAIFVAPLAMEGSVERTEKGLRLNPDKLQGRSIDRQPDTIRNNVPRLELWPQPDGTLRCVNPKLTGRDFTLKREAKPGG